MDDRTKQNCLSDETIAGFVEGLLTGQQTRAVERHMEDCPSCRDLVTAQRRVHRHQEKMTLAVVPADVTQSARDLMPAKDTKSVWELLIEFSEKMFESIQTTGEILLGPGMKSANALRGSVDDSVRTLVVRKTFDSFTIEITIAQDGRDTHDLFMRVQRGAKSSVPSHLRATLSDGQDELESHPILQGKAAFKKIKPGSYRLEIADPQKIFEVIQLKLVKQF